MIITADWHLTDAPADQYRWDVFTRLQNLMAATHDYHVVILGDLTDRKDRHSGSLVNGLLYNLRRVMNTFKGSTIEILMGNHDKPLNGPPYWRMLNSLRGSGRDIQFYDKPAESQHKGLVMLPYSDNPAEDWKDVDFSKYKAAFMHQTVTGVVTNNGRTLTNSKMALFPKRLKVYSGDIHTPQIVGTVTYVGAPHPVKHGDTYQCRMLQLDADYDIVRVEEIETIRKHVIYITSPTDLDKVPAGKGDQAVVRVALTLDRVEGWPNEQDEIRKWARDMGVTITSLDAVFGSSVEGVRGAVAEGYDVLSDYGALFDEFVLEEGIPEGLVEVGVSLLSTSLTAEEMAEG